MSKTSPEVLQQIRQLTAEGKNSKEIGQILGKSAKAIQKLFARYKIPHLPRGAQQGKKNHFWKRGWTVDKDGYRLVRAMDHPTANNSGYIREHRLVIEEKLGRYLTPSEVVHHIDGNKLNNDLSNLKLFSENGLHLREELTGRVPKWSEGGIHRIREAVKKAVRYQKRAPNGRFV